MSWLLQYLWYPIQHWCLVGGDSLSLCMTEKNDTFELLDIQQLI